MKPAYPSLAIKIFIVVGLIGLALLATLPMKFTRLIEQERQRFSACEKKMRTDCRPSPIWIFHQWQIVSPTSTADIVPKE